MFLCLVHSSSSFALSKEERLAGNGYFGFLPGQLLVFLDSFEGFGFAFGHPIFGAKDCGGRGSRRLPLFYLPSPTGSQWPPGETKCASHICGPWRQRRPCTHKLSVHTAWRTTNSSHPSSQALPAKGLCLQIYPRASSPQSSKHSAVSSSGPLQCRHWPTCDLPRPHCQWTASRSRAASTRERRTSASSQ